MVQILDMGWLGDVFLGTKTILGLLVVFFFFIVDLLLLEMTCFAWGFKWARAAMVAMLDPGIVP